MFLVHDLASAVATRPETLGTKEKYWVNPKPGGLLSLRPHLYKIGRENTGENWSEKIACELAASLGIPAATYNFAVYENTKGVITERFLPNTGTLLLGNMLLSFEIDTYDDAKSYKQPDYRLLTVLHILASINPRPPVMDGFCYSEVMGIDYFIGYLVFDFLIGNTDRHHENWGLVINDFNNVVDVHLAPSFDHASCLGRNETEARREMRLCTNDHRGTVEAYADRARSAFYGAAPSSSYILTREVLSEILRVYPAATRFWGVRILQMTDQKICDIFAEVPPEWMSDQAREFAKRMLRHNRHVITEICNAA